MYKGLNKQEKQEKSAKSSSKQRGQSESFTENSDTIVQKKLQDSADKSKVISNSLKLQELANQSQEVQQFQSLNKDGVNSSVIQKKDAVSKNFVGVKIHLYQNTYDESKGAHAFSFYTQLLFSNLTGDDAFLADLDFQQLVSSKSEKKSAGAKNFSTLHQTNTHDDGYSSADFTKSGSTTPDVSFVMTSDSPGAYGVFFPNDEILWTFNFRHIVKDKSNGKTVHDTGTITITVSGKGSGAQMNPGAGSLYNSVGL